MRHALAIAAALLTFAGAAGVSLAAPQAGGDSTAGPAWIASLADQELVAVDGSTITLSPMEGQLILSFVSHSGVAQKTTFTYLADNLGTVADEGDGAKVSGFFRQTDIGLEIQYGDGRTASLFANVADGLTMTRKDQAGASVCVSWYPAGHVFSEDERRAAVVAYAESLGVSQPAQPSKKKTHVAPASACSPAMRAPMRGALVRSSAVRPIESEPAKAAPPTLVPPAAAPPANVPPPPPATPSPSMAASNCLSVESDGANLGFRNRCGYGVQYAFCLLKTTDSAVLCGAGIKTGGVAANGFAALIVRDAQTLTTEHDFRWVGCSGEPGRVSARLDSTDPPAGRCISAN